MAPGPGKEKERLKSTGSGSKKPTSSLETKLQCDKCRMAVSSLICCERRVMWMCMSCAEIMSEVKYAILKEDDMTWFCTPCRGLAVQAAQTDKLIEDRCRHYMAKAMEEIHCVKTELKEDIRAVTTDVTKLVEDVGIIKNEITKICSLREDMEEIKKSAAVSNRDQEVDQLKDKISQMSIDLEKGKEDASREMTQLEIRRHNIIAFNVPEGNSKDIENRKQHDREYFKHICDDLKLEGIEVTGITRLQSQNAKPGETEKPRPLRIRLRTEDMKIQILQNAKHLATSETNRNVHLKRDMTFLERTQAARTREARKTKEGEEKRTEPV